MEFQTSSPSMRDRLGTLLRDSRFVIALEVLFVILLAVLRVPGKVILLFLLGWLSLWLRRSGWKKIGMSPPPNWTHTLLAGLGISAVYQFFSIGILVPLLHRLTNTSLDLSQFEPLRDNFATLVIALIVSWTLAAFGEEMVYRGYVLNRLADLFGNNPFSWGLAVLISSLLFGFGHIYQGTVGIIETFVFGAVAAGLYLANQRNLWLPILFHGFNNTIGFVLIFFGLYP